MKAVATTISHMRSIHPPTTQPLHQDFENLASGTNVMENVRGEDWAKFTLPSWRHSIWVGVFDPIFWMLRPHLWIKILRDAFTLNVFHSAFKDGLMGYGMVYATKKK